MSKSYKLIVERIFEKADIKVNGKRPQDIQVKDDRFYHYFLKNTRLALGESYVDSWWECEDLWRFFSNLFTADLQESFDMKNLNFLMNVIKAKIVPWGSIDRSRFIGPNHYDNGNTLYRHMLGETLQYSCGYWRNGAKNLDEAQWDKLELICRKLDLKEGMTLLDIGCGWGVLAKYAAQKYKVKVVGITVSKAQLEYGQELCKGLPVELRYQDYRDVSEKFDRVVSIGMMCHVGVPYHRVYMESVAKSLNNDGLFLLHHIATNKSEWSNLWLDKYIFPGAKPPSLAETARAAEGLFVIEDVHNIGYNYYLTMREWYENFERCWNEIKDKYSDEFYRMWKYYLVSVGAGFGVREIQVIQTILTKKGTPGGYHYPGNYNLD